MALRRSCGCRQFLSIDLARPPPYPDFQKPDGGDTELAESLGMVVVKLLRSNASICVIGGGVDHNFLCQLEKAKEDSDVDPIA